ncbi:MAG: hypothetical protein Q8R28_13515 [Dehalococcoidia bacterium]|nr:hypothetical protein [Dehalococcoidia bacterium]
MGEELKRELLSLSLQAAVPLLIQDLVAKGGPDAGDYGRAREAGDFLGQKGDHLLFKGKHTAEAFNKMAFGVAVLAFLPGGVEVFGVRYRASE